MVAIPLAATLLTAILRRQRNKEVRRPAESSCLGSDLNLYGTMRTAGSFRSEPAPFTMEENSNKYHRSWVDGAPPWWKSGTLRSPSSTGSTCHGSAPPSCVQRWLQAFSLQTTTQGIFSTSSAIQGASYSSLNGIRVLSLLWIMSGHSTELVLAGLGKERDPRSSYRFRTSSLWVLAVNSVHSRQQSELAKGCREQPSVRALLGWAFFSGRGHFFITRVRKPPFQGWGAHILVTFSFILLLKGSA